MKRFLRFLLKVILAIMLIILVLSVSLWLKSPGKTAPITNDQGEVIPGSIARIEALELGGLEQYLIIRGKDTTHPVLLFLHGGPGAPELAFLLDRGLEMEDHFTVVYWEQRGAGKSYSKDIPPETMNLEQFISDTRELSTYLTQRFGKEKIYLMGHSWGSLLGILTAYQHPELFHEYIGIGQVAHQYRSEQLSYEWLKEEARKRGNEAVLKELEEVEFPEPEAEPEDWMKYSGVHRKYVMKYGGGISHEITSMWPVAQVILEAREYTLSEKIHYPAGNNLSTEHLWEELIDSNLSSRIDSMQLPVHIVQGVLDYQTAYQVARDFYEQLKAPEKHFYTFEHSAHSPLGEEPQKFNKIVRMLVNDGK